jgi:hypothetical protein
MITRIKNFLKRRYERRLRTKVALHCFPERSGYIDEIVQYILNGIKSVE